MLLNFSKPVELYFHLKKDLLSHAESISQFRANLLGKTIHLFVQNIWKRSKNINDFVKKVCILIDSEIVCGYTFTKQEELMCVRFDVCDRDGFYVCPIVETIEKIYKCRLKG